jgi:hypothetical protein
MRFFINSFREAVIFFKHESYILFLVGVLSRSVSVSPSRPSVISHMAYHRVPFYLQPFIIYSILMHHDGCGHVTFATCHKYDTAIFLSAMGSNRKSAIDGLLQTMEDKSER